jgi:glycosyltransferase involved in cell wall biosynthesis
MIKGKTVAVVIPAYNEEKQITSVIETMPDFVDRIVIVDDCSSDQTSQVVRSIIDSGRVRGVPLPEGVKQFQRTKYNKADRFLKKLVELEARRYTPAETYIGEEPGGKIVLIRHQVNASVGAAISTGYKWCRDQAIDCTAVMAGDGQMDPSELESICLPIVDDADIDYVKGNRLSHRSAFFVVPKVRYFGNSILSLLTKIASGYWRVSDTQTGYTAIGLRALNSIRIHDIYKSYGCPNDILVKLNISFCTIKEIPIKPIYHVGEQSKMRVLKVIPRISLLLFKCFWKRLYVKYLFQDFHPLFLFYHLSFFMLVMDIPFFIQVLQSLSPDVTLAMQNLVIFVFLTTGGLQSLFFAMWMDMTDNDRLQRL